LLEKGRKGTYKYAENKKRAEKEDRQKASKTHGL